VLGAYDAAGWGILQQVRVSAGDPGQGFQLWPAADRMPLMCRRDGNGGFVWHAVTPSTA